LIAEDNQRVGSEGGPEGRERRRWNLGDKGTQRAADGRSLDGLLLHILHA